MSVVCRGHGPPSGQRPMSSSGTVVSSDKLLASKVCDLRDPDNGTTAPTPPSRPQTSYNMYPFRGMHGPETPRSRQAKKPSSASCTRSTPRRPPIAGESHASHVNQHGQSQLALSSPWQAMLPRPSSPLPVAPAAVLDHLAHEAHPHVKPSDLRHINTWLHSLDVESKNFTSYFLFCEMKFRESSVLTTGKPMPNRLRTAVAFHCLQHATSLFGRYQHVLGTICQSLGAAIYSDYDARHVASRQHAEASTVSAVDWYEKGTAYFQMAEQLRGQVDGLQAQVTAAEFEAERLREEVAALTSQCDALKRLRGRNTRPSLVVELQNMGAMDKVDMIFKTFQSFDAANRRNILVGLIQTVEQNLSAEMLFDVVQAMAHEEGERLAQMLMREYDVGTTKKTTNEHVKKLQRFVTGFASTLKEVNKSVPVHEAAAAEQTTAELQAERATFEKMLLLKTEMQTLKENHEIELQFEMDKTKLFEEECKELMTKYQDALKRIPKPPEVSDHAVQVDIMEAETATKRKKKRGDVRGTFLASACDASDVSLGCRRRRRVSRNLGCDCRRQPPRQEDPKDLFKETRHGAGRRCRHDCELVPGQDDPGHPRRLQWEAAVGLPQSRRGLVHPVLWPERARHRPAHLHRHCRPQVLRAQCSRETLWHPDRVECSGVRHATHGTVPRSHRLLPLPRWRPLPRWPLHDAVRACPGRCEAAQVSVRRWNPT
ncbi:hypothetical protein, variant [Aphanomyces invadans]|uniref:Uncharacterized protein n=1 Tax=Aphanomyces invadans TaxID=157072 RepID=A0A024UH96_9STRA|nr:hypothetical protein, variant [Aphanomyces invadans]ETW05570.1 hypothetical protein, variant [Aphanomyces invadans]|eukprot:XP_008865347.1 hypothetical protein, variant [Aphanomyces invadans]